jgi:hypothetical protein
MIILIIQVKTTDYVEQMLEHFNFSHFVLLTPYSCCFVHVLTEWQQSTFLELEYICISPLALELFF